MLGSIGGRIVGGEGAAASAGVRVIARIPLSQPHEKRPSFTNSVSPQERRSVFDLESAYQQTLNELPDVQSLVSDDTYTMDD